jgi:adenylate kinase family enzyme
MRPLLRPVRAVLLVLLVLGFHLQLAHAGPPVAAAAPAAKRVVVFVGMPGSGKSTVAARLARRFGTKHISTGDAIRKEIADRGLEYNATNDRAVALELSKQPGEIARRAADTVLADPSPLSIIEGFRSPADVAAFRAKVPQALVVAIEVGTTRRHARQLLRGRAGEDNVAYLRDRDRSEIRRGQRDVMRMADIRIRPKDDDEASMVRAEDRVLRAADARARQLAPAPTP